MTKETKKGYSLGFAGVALLVAETIILISSGGFFEETVMLAGVIVAVMAVWKLSSIRISLSQFFFFLFAVWYFICSVRNGFVLEYAARGLIPTVVFIFWMFISACDMNRKKLADILLEISVWIAFVAVVHCVVISLGASSLLRLRFPFDYPNACGIYFAVCYFSAEKSGSKFIRKAKHLFLLSLLLTQSVGSIGIFVLALIYELIINKEYKKLISMAVILSVLLFFLRERVWESMGTFLERLLHIYDGVLCIADNPIFGIGAGWWEIAKQYYQTGFYTANTIHSSIIQIGVNSGIIGILLFFAAVSFEIRYCFKTGKNAIVPIMILVHSIFDFTLSFLGINIFLLLMFDTEIGDKELILKPIARSFAGILLVLSFGFVVFGLYNSALFQKNLSEQENMSVVSERYNESYMLNKSIKSVRSYAASLYTEKYYDVNTSFPNYKYLPPEIILYQSLSENKGGEYLAEQLKGQPYNTALRDIITKDFKGDTSNEVNCIVSNAADTASYFGKILYILKGENYEKV